MFCSHCGQELKEGGKFCPRCGAPVDPAAGAGFSTGYQKMNPGPQGAVMKKGVSPAVAGCDYRSDPGVYRRGRIYGIFPVFQEYL